MSYNGWKNRETWAVKLHLDNDQGLYNDYHDLYKEVSKEEPTSEVLTPDKEALYKYSDQLKQWVSDILRPSYWRECGMDMPRWAELMNEDVGSLWRVDWDGITKSILEDIRVVEEYDSKVVK
tara:strand:+ start:135 stop:500 length:366 start_codon:yes stop_codon:yes gene_type:complete